ncbi:uncharacterized protein LOC127721721 [Mytilus californianus]|uniref:uncharacterized protein LOC127721721 n=1 Tax=Mytilus californianus TaxID=6549 RepID=UPI00224549C6|nr:uncharacterized protein LOC127721721 [Mytilus californianus]
MTNVIIREPTNSNSNVVTTNNEVPVNIRTMTRSENDCKFVADLKVEAKKAEYIHATSAGSISTIKRITERNHEEQDDWFYERNFIAEYNGDPVGILTLSFPADMIPVKSDYETEFGCTDLCGLSCLNNGLDETVGEGSLYVNYIYVIETYRMKGIEEHLLQMALKEALKNNISVIFLYVGFGNSYKNLYLDQGFAIVNKTCCCIWCSMGVCGFYKMEKRLVL